MWVDVLTKPLQGAKFHLMHSFLMNCPIDYSEDHVITSIPTSLPMLSKNKISSSSPKHNQPFILLDKPTDILMKKRSLQPTPSSWVCVETKSHGTTVPRSSRTYEHVKAKVTWKDTLFPCRHPTSSPSPCAAKKRALTHKLINISIFNVKLAKWLIHFTIASTGAASPWFTGRAQVLIALEYSMRERVWIGHKRTMDRNIRFDPALHPPQKTKPRSREVFLRSLSVMHWLFSH